jgi:hypothetical protein
MSRCYGWTISAGSFAAILASFATLAVAAGPSLKYFKPLALPVLDKEELVAVPLDSDVYEVTRAGLPDLRLLDAANTEVTFIVRKAVSKRDETIRETWTARRKPSAKPLDTGGLEITLELERDEPMPNGLRLVSPQRDFEHRVQVESSADGQTWQPLVRDGLIFDYAKYIDVRNDAVKWPPAEAPRRHIRITIDDVTEEQESQLMELTRRLRGDDVAEKSERLIIDRRPFRIERIEFWRDVIRERVTGDLRADYSLSGMKVTNDADDKQTHITVDSRREPLASLSLVTESRNFSRAAQVEVEREQGGQNTWHAISSGNVSRIDVRNLDRTNLAISVPETRQARYRLVIENRDSAPLAITGVSARGPVYEVVFLADPKVEYRVAYGGSSIDSPNYDTAALTASLGAGYTPLAAELGEQGVLSQEVVTGEPFFKRLINDTRLLTIAIAILVILLGLGLYQATRRVNRQIG